MAGMTFSNSKGITLEELYKFASALLHQFQVDGTVKPDVYLNDNDVFVQIIVRDEEV